MNNITEFPVPDCQLVVDPNDVLNAAINNVSKVVVIGVQKDGSLYCASSHNEAEASFLLLRAQNFLINLSGDNE